MGQGQTSGSESGELVRLNVYTHKDGHQGLPGFGVYHSGVEVYDTEYCYAAGPSSASGVVAHRPKVPPAGAVWKFYMQVDIARTHLNATEVKVALKDIGRDFAASAYDLVARNCNHFSDAFCIKLTGSGIPGWVNRAASVGGLAKRFIDVDTSATGNQQRTGAGMAQSSTAAGHSAESTKMQTTVDLTDRIDLMKVGCLNHIGVVRLVFDPKSAVGTTIESASDEQLLFHIPFKSPVHIHSFQMVGTPDGTAPRALKLYVNQQSIDFNDVDDRVETLSLSLKPMDWRASPLGSKLVECNLKLPLAAFRKVTNLTVFVSANMEDTETTRINLMRFMGTSD